MVPAISIHALLAESDPLAKVRHCEGYIFLSTLSLRRATFATGLSTKSINISIHALLAESDDPDGNLQLTRTISIHALLAESDACNWIYSSIQRNFYPRSPCGERQPQQFRLRDALEFLSTLSLRRATLAGHRRWTACRISIHALLAESDCQRWQLCCADRDFYPRSPCGERLANVGSYAAQIVISIHALLAESDPDQPIGRKGQRYFYPRSPCGERRTNVRHQLKICAISIHALLAESDTTANKALQKIEISIHALLAESDGADYRSHVWTGGISIHALLAESDPFSPSVPMMRPYFYPRSPCGERLSALYASCPRSHFYPRSPCGERRPHQRYFAVDENFYPRSPCGERPIFAVRPYDAPVFLSTLSLRRATQRWESLR